MRHETLTSLQMREEAIDRRIAITAGYNGIEPTDQSGGRYE